MEKLKYVFVDEVGADVFGTVWKAVDRYSDKVFAIKFFKAFVLIHEEGYFHRDIKPEILLVSGDLIKIGDMGSTMLVSGDWIKIGDMGSTKKINSGPPHAFLIMSLWYRPPEVVLFSPNYNYHVDMWAMGAIMAELMMLRPLFPSKNASDQMSLLCSV
ncbi:hypothetical protein LWI28_010735 [Acer negundo]|uniref:Protein kinase domain-containing protein n=1 Tax=Acer negundo TaxID=4023 RepID=A0AAD5IGX1_ACENE|nr:hypothetical protein LWI28_010735 [Acer negundo]